LKTQPCGLRFLSLAWRGLFTHGDTPLQISPLSLHADASRPDANLRLALPARPTEPRHPRAREPACAGVIAYRPANNPAVAHTAVLSAA
jgi:hypothetical protein